MTDDEAGTARFSAEGLNKKPEYKQKSQFYISNTELIVSDVCVVYVMKLCCSFMAQ
jgi:hypothetical protein